MIQMNLVTFTAFVHWLTDNEKDINPENWELRVIEFELGYRCKT